MADLREQARAIINVCKTASKNKGQGVDNQTIATAQAILAQGKTLSPNDKVLSAVTLDAPVLWTSLQTAMEMVVASVPAPEAFRLAEALEKGRKRVISRNAPIQDAIASYKTALAEYERLSQTESPSYSIVEICKTESCRCFLESRGIPTSPSSVKATA